VSESVPGSHCVRLADSAAYVLGALEEPEAEAHYRHLSECPICRADLARHQPVADSLALGVPRADLPPGLRARIVSVVPAEAGQPESAGRSTARWRRRLAPALASALSLAIGFSIGALALHTGSGEHNQVVRAIVVAPGHSATAELRKTGSHLELVVLGMPSPPPGHIYQVWIERGAREPRPTDALFSVTRVGSGAVDVPGDLEGVSKVLVTAEPLGGSPKPTRNPVIVGSI
jgi:anti-sigma-K factor RskA